MVLQVCNITLLGAAIEVGNRALNSHNGSVSFIVCNGFNGLAVNASYSRLPGSSSVTIDSVSCIDSDEDSLDVTHPVSNSVIYLILGFYFEIMLEKLCSIIPKLHFSPIILFKIFLDLLFRIIVVIYSYLLNHE